MLLDKCQPVNVSIGRYCRETVYNLMYVHKKNTNTINSITNYIHFDFSFSIFCILQTKPEHKVDMGVTQNNAFIRVIVMFKTPTNNIKFHLNHLF